MLVFPLGFLTPAASGCLLILLLYNSSFLYPPTLNTAPTLTGGKLKFKDNINAYIKHGFGFSVLQYCPVHDVNKSLMCEANKVLIKIKIEKPNTCHLEKVKRNF